MNRPRAEAGLMARLASLFHKRPPSGYRDAARRRAVLLEAIEPRLLFSTVVFSDSFEGGFTGTWIVSNDGGINSAAWGDNTAQQVTGTFSGFVADNGNNSRHTYDNDLHTTMERRGISLVGCTTANVTFQYWINTEAGADIFRVNVRDQAGNWTEMFQDSGDGSAAEFQSKSINLSSFLGQSNIYIQFRFDSNASVVPAGTAGVWVDDVKVRVNGPAFPTVPAYSSLPGAAASLFLDFNGDAATTWGQYSVSGTMPYSGAGDDNPFTFSAQENDDIQHIWSWVAEKYSPFNINVTTVDPGNLNNNQTQKVVIGGRSSDWFGTYAGGVSFIGAFHDGSPNISYVFANNPFTPGNIHYLGDTVAHEAGHAFGLNHERSRLADNSIDEYYDGDSIQSPIMGGSSAISTQRSLWWKTSTSAPQNSPDAIQDELQIITGLDNGFGYRPDDHGNTAATAAALTAGAGTWSGSGIIETATDTDYFSFTTAAGQINFTVNVATYGPMLDSTMELRDSSGNLIVAADTASLSETLTRMLAAGSYRLAIFARGHGTDSAYYGNLGQYSITGTFAADQVPTIMSLSADPTALVRPTAVTLTANGVADTDGTVASVIFYRDSNGDGVLQVGSDELLGQDNSSSGGWTWSGSSAGFPIGIDWFFAVAVDNLGDSSAAASTTVAVSDHVQIAGTGGDDHYYVRRNPADVGIVQVFLGDSASGSPAYSLPLAQVLSLTFNGLGGNDVITVDSANGSPAPAGRLFFKGGVGADTFNVTGGAYSFTSDAGADTASLTINVSNNADVHFQSSQHLAGLNIIGTAMLGMGGNLVVVTRSLTLGGGKFDLADNQVIVDYDSGSPSPMSDLRAQLIAGYGAGHDWTGASGITSSLGNAATYAVGSAEVSDIATSFPAMIVGESVDSSAVLLRFTHYGDANLDGQTDFADLGILLNHFNGSGGWSSGNFNYDGGAAGSVDFADLGLLLNNFNSGLPGQPAPGDSAPPPFSSEPIRGGPEAEYSPAALPPAVSTATVAHATSYPVRKPAVKLSAHAKSIGKVSHATDKIVTKVTPIVKASPFRTTGAALARSVTSKPAYGAEPFGGRLAKRFAC